MKKLLFGLFPALLLSSAAAQAAIQTKAVQYKHGDAVLEGTLAYDDALPGPRPGVLVAHEWWGRNDYVRRRAEELAKLGYVAFALDMYGKGKQTQDPKQAAAWADTYKSDRALMRARAQAGLDILKNQKRVDPHKIAAMGYCFGGTCALELARSGADLRGVVSFHGGLNTPKPEDAKNIKGKILALCGGDDPYVPPAEVAAFEDEMRKGGVNWQLTQYGDAVHGFTNPAAGGDKSKGMAYNAQADARSWEAMKAFLAEVFK